MAQFRSVAILNLWAALFVCLFVCNVKSIGFPYTSITYHQPMQFNIPELLGVYYDQ